MHTTDGTPPAYPVERLPKDVLAARQVCQRPCKNHQARCDKLPWAYDICICSEFEQLGPGKPASNTPAKDSTPATARKIEHEPLHVPAMLVHGVGVRCAIYSSIGSTPRLAELCQATKHGFVLAHEGTTFYVNTRVKHPNVWFHVSVIAHSKADADKMIIFMAFLKSEWLGKHLGIDTSYVAESIDMQWKTRAVYMPPVELDKLRSDPWLLPGILSDADLERIAGEYPEPAPGQLNLHLVGDLRGFIESEMDGKCKIRFPKATLSRVIVKLGILEPKDGFYGEGLDEGKVVAILRKYDEFSFEQLCEQTAAHDAEGGCAEICQGKPDEVKHAPVCCPVVDFRDLVRMLSKAYPHAKQKPAFGGYAF